ncbi:FtsX-like permease family protein [Kitasatospora cystarginea]|uniref:FtsX-like permease family protein n=1 Tax=Kitasatospora cystarginea TaxID=58350 RepID=A0ABP5Q651_9ACTN
MSEPRARSLAGAPWVRTRLRTAPTAALLTAALVFVTAFLAAALPRALDRGADQALRELVRRHGPLAGSVSVTVGRFAPAAGSEAASGDPAADLDRKAGAIAGDVPAPLRLAAGGPVYGSAGRFPRELPDGGLPRPGGLPPKLGLVYLNAAAGHARLVAGRWPTGAAPRGHVEVALSEATAATLGVRAGSTLNAGAPGAETGAGVSAEVVGLYRPDQVDSAFWAGTPCLAAACLSTVRIGFEAVPFWSATGLVGRDGLPGLGAWSAGSTDFYQLPFDLAALHADRLPAARSAVASLIAGPANTRLVADLGQPGSQVTSTLPQLFDEAAHRQTAVAPLTEVGPAGAAAVAVAVLCLAAALAAERRAGELRLLRARGASRAGVLGRLLGETAVTVLPAGLAGTLLALVVLPTGRWVASVLAALAVTLVAALGLPLRALALSAAPRPGGGRRRLVAELAVAAATAGALAAVRRRGVASGGDGVDLLLVGAPLLLALTGALVLARLHPVLIGWAARRAGRRPGLVGFLGLARAARGDGRHQRPSVLPLLALLLAVTTAGFGATVLDSVAAARERAALTAVGAGARVAAVSAAALPEGFATAAARLPGAGAATAAWTFDAAPVGTPGGALISDVTVIVIDPVVYAALARDLGQGVFDPALLADDGRAGSPVPALASPDVAERLGGAPRAARLRSGELQVRVAGVVDGTPAVNGAGGSKTMVLPAGPVARRFPGIGRPNLWLATGRLAADPLRELLQRLSPADAAATGPARASAAASASGAGSASGAASRQQGRDSYSVRTKAETAEELAADPLQHTAARLFWTSVAAAGGFALLAVLLTLVRAAPERAALLARLRTMGLRPRQGLALILAEALPQPLVAALAGGLVALSAAPLLGPAVDLAALVGAPVPAGLRTAWLPVLLQVLALVAVATATVAAEVAVSGRRQITTELRAGDVR